MGDQVETSLAIPEARPLGPIDQATKQYHGRCQTKAFSILHLLFSEGQYQ